MRETTKLDEYYNKFNEEKRLDSRHGRIEYRTSRAYIDKYLRMLMTGDTNQDERIDNGISAKPDGCIQDVIDGSVQGEKADSILDKKDIRILDIGAGTGRYSIPLSEEGYDVTAVEPTHPNLGRLRANGKLVHVYEGNALKLKQFHNASFDLVIMFGPMYHLKTQEERLQALLEAKRVVKPGGYIFTTYILNEYALLTYAFVENHALECKEKGALTRDFRCIPGEDDLYGWVRIEDMDELNEKAGLHRVCRFTQDGPANYMRRVVNAMDEETYELYYQYHLSICERPELLGAAAHVADVLKRE